jgi:hypothetical protein
MLEPGHRHYWFNTRSIIPLTTAIGCVLQRLTNLQSSTAEAEKLKVHSTQYARTSIAMRPASDR